MTQYLGEIARKPNNSSDLAGRYTVVWIEEDGRSHDAILNISPVEANTAWLFTWTRGNTEIFRGRGMNVGRDQIAVIYWASDGGGLAFP